MVKTCGFVWNYYTRKVCGSQVTAFCKFCNQSYVQNATRMEKHMERCVKCPEDIKQDFLNKVSNKRIKFMLTKSIDLGDNYSESSAQSIENNINEFRKKSLENMEKWMYNNQLNGQAANVNNDEVEDSKEWNVGLQTDNVETVITNTNDGWQPPETEKYNEPAPVAEEIQEPIRPSTYVRKIPSYRKTSQLPSHSGRFSAYSILQHKIQQEQFLERRTLRRIAELELQRKALELKKLQWEYEKQKTESEVRWAHECCMMQLKEERERQLIEEKCSDNIFKTH